MATDKSDLLKAALGVAEQYGKDLLSDQRTADFAKRVLEDLVDARWTALNDANVSIRALAQRRAEDRVAQLAGEARRLGLEAVRESRLLGLLEGIGGLLLKVAPALL